ncbi:Transcription elongation factor GreB [Ferriphaselus amnicola]|uniref:Transcription elongation factor GreB n=1 Tax=Ferriphaselus amnicola TaxID=1188319 RepID=A0A2Z6G9N2_9PROT|nr:transcription elongation factor GreB [Ferriphaselus amnicola]BBE50114.1 Transcription elongation factor GreB [Ferriphaselus amnicola]
MSKAFTKESDGDEDDDLDPALKLPVGTKNYITPAGYQRLQDELDHLWKRERPELVKTITWAASNGDRSENGDYIYGKKRLREIDRRVRFLRKRLENALVVDPATRGDCEQIFFGATVTVERGDGVEATYSIVGVDEANAGRGLISWVSPLAQTLFKAREDDVVTLRGPAGVEELVVLVVEYREIILGG